MSDNKKYYYLKLKEDFFDSPEMILIESMKKGHLYSNILLKFYLKSLKANGRLMLNDKIPFDSEMLAEITRHTVKTVEEAITVFKKFGLIEVLENGVIYMLDIQNHIGKSSSEADRIRQYRANIESERTKAVQMLQQTYDICTPEKEIEKEIEIDNTEHPPDSSYGIEEFFEQLWKLYPKKEGKGQVSMARKKKLYSIGLDEMIRAIERYKIAKKGVEKQFLQNGSTFFNSGYVDYLDENFSRDKQKPEPAEIKVKEFEL